VSHQRASIEAPSISRVSPQSSDEASGATRAGQAGDKVAGEPWPRVFDSAAAYPARPNLRMEQCATVRTGQIRDQSTVHQSCVDLNQPITRLAPVLVPTAPVAPAVSPPGIALERHTALEPSTVHHDTAVVQRHRVAGGLASSNLARAPNQNTASGRAKSVRLPLTGFHWLGHRRYHELATWRPE
jgi:hypothetical protein